MKHLLTFEQFLLEQQNSNERVVCFPGRFMPVHLGHLASFKKTSEIFGLKVIPLQIISKNENSPFPITLLEKIAKDITKEYDFIADFFIYPQTLKTVVPQMVKYLREQGYEAIGMGCGSDRSKSYEPQIKYLNSDKSDVPISEPFKLEIVDERVKGGPSGTKVREAIKNGDENLFEQLTPECIHKYYKDFKKYI